MRRRSRATSRRTRNSRQQRNGGALEELEPHVSGLAAIHVPSTGIINYRRVAETMAALLQEAGADLRTGTEVRGISPYEEARKLGRRGQAGSTRFAGTRS